MNVCLEEGCFQVVRNRRVKGSNQCEVLGGIWGGYSEMGRMMTRRCWVREDT